MVAPLCVMLAITTTVSAAGSQEPGGSVAQAPLGEQLPRENFTIKSALAVDLTRNFARLPLYRGRVGNTSVWYVITDVSDQQLAEERGLNFAPKLANLITPQCPGCIQTVTSAPDLGTTEVQFAGAPDFAPTRLLVPGPDGGFPPLRSSPGAIANPGYSPYVRIAGTQIVYNAPIVAVGDGTGSTFDDDDDNEHEGFIEALAARGETTGCPATAYCPAVTLTRAQLASFLVRALGVPVTTQDFFTDDDGSTHEESINRLAAAGIATGVGPSRFGPDLLVSRAQTASFLARALHLGELPGPRFSDVDGVHAGAVNAVAEAGFVLGCSSDRQRFCPAAGLRRDQMASLLGRALGLAPLAPPPTFDVTHHTNTHDRMLAIDPIQRTVDMNFIRAFSHGRDIMYLSFESSSALTAVLDRSTFTPTLGLSPAPDRSRDPATARSAIFAFANGQTGTTSPPAQGNDHVITDGLNAETLNLQNTDLLEALRLGGDAHNVLDSFPTLADPAARELYSPLWDVNITVWSDAAVAAGRNIAQTDANEIRALGIQGEVSSPGGELLASDRSILNCPALAFLTTPPEADQVPVPTGSRT